MVVVLAVVGAFVAPSAAYASWGGKALRNGWYGCLDADRNNWDYNFARVQLWNCNGWTNQQWWANFPANGATTTTEIRTPGPPSGPADMCLDSWRDQSAWSGYAVYLYKCNLQDQQRWIISARVVNNFRILEIRNVKWNLCLDMYDQRAFDGGPVGLIGCYWDGYAHPTQEWSDV